MPNTDEFLTIFNQFKAILKRYEKNCLVDKDTDTEYYLNTKKLDQNQKPIFFAATIASTRFRSASI